MRDEIPTQFLQAMAGRFATLADVTRLEIIHRLMKEGEQNVTRLVEATGQSHPNVSKHLRRLRDAGLVARRKEGLQVYYRLDDPLTMKLCQLVCDTLLEEYDSQQEREPS